MKKISELKPLPIQESSFDLETLRSKLSNILYNSSLYPVGNSDILDALLCLANELHKLKNK